MTRRSLRKRRHHAPECDRVVPGIVGHAVLASGHVAAVDVDAEGLRRMLVGDRKGTAAFREIPFEDRDDGPIRCPLDPVEWPAIGVPAVTTRKD